MGQQTGEIRDGTSNGVMLRHAYGWWDINESFQILADKNWGNPRGLIGNSLPAMISSATFDPFTNKIDDADTYSYWFDLSYQFGVITPHLVFGEMSTSNKILDFDMDSKSRMWGLSVPIDLAKRLQGPSRSYVV